MLQTTRPKLTPKSQDDILAPAVERLRQATTTDSVGRENEWADNVADALGKLEVAFRQHRTGAKSAEGGVLAEVDEIAPTVARQADEVRGEHDDLLIRIVELRDKMRQMVRTPLSGTDLDAIRECVETVITELEKNRHAETALLQESVNTDIGVAG